MLLQKPQSVKFPDFILGTSTMSSSIWVSAHFLLSSKPMY